MAGVLDSVDQRTQLVGENRLELLLFTLNSVQLFALNVFKIKEVLTLPDLTLIPGRNNVVCGVIHIRGATMPVIDLSGAIGLKPITPTDTSTVIITEYNRSVQAFLVGNVDRIINLNWADMMPPPSGAGRSHYLTAVTRVDERIVEIVDVEKVLAEIAPFDTEISEGVLDDGIENLAEGLQVLMADDSYTALAQAEATLKHMGIEVIKVMDGLKALELLQSWADSGINVSDKLLMVITDAEMPVMDGYRLTAEIRKDDRLKDLFVVLHTSLSGNFNKAMVDKVGCDDFVSKFQPDVLAKVAQDRVKVFRS